jgi:hypothetical protein
MTSFLFANDPLFTEFNQFAKIYGCQFCNFGAINANNVMAMKPHKLKFTTVKATEAGVSCKKLLKL